MPNRYERDHGYDVMRLPEKVRAEVLQQWADSQLHDDWWDFTYQDATRMGALLGIDVSTINFTGFWSQGDGASFAGRYECKPDAVDAVTKECGGTDERLIGIARELTRMQADCKLRLGDTFECEITNNDSHCSHSGTMQVNDYGKESLDCPELDTLATEFRTVLRSFADWIYRQLEKECEYLTSEEMVLESIRSSGLRFDADGDTI